MRVALIGFVLVVGCGNSRNRAGDGGPLVDVRDDVSADLRVDVRPDVARDTRPDTSTDTSTDTRVDAADARQDRTEMDASRDLAMDSSMCSAEDAGGGADVMTLDSAGPGGTLRLGQPCDPSNNQCVSGTLCCRACCLPSAVPVCTRPDASGSCPLPDVRVDEAYMRASVYESTQDFGVDACAIEEGCIGGTGTRRLLNFGVRIPNTGTDAMRIGVPSTSNPNFEYSACHAHFHFAQYGRYRLLDAAGCVIARGHKNGWCVIDLEQVVSGSPSTGMFSCSNMGISAGWADVYGAGTACQWVDITDVPPGNYILEATVNPDRVLTESDYGNNTARVPVTIGPSSIDAGMGDGGVDAGPVDVTAACPGGGSGPSRNCGWTVVGNRSCTPAALVRVGCNATCMPPAGSCTGDAMIRVCDGSDNPCTLADSIGNDDDSCSTLCPLASVLCPSSGQITVLSGPYNSGASYSCTVQVR